MAREKQTILDTWQTRGIKKKEGASQTYDTPSRFKTYVKFAEYYKSVTKINCYVGKSFVSQLQLIRMALENSCKLREI